MAGQSNPIPARSPCTGRVPTILGIITVLAAVLALSGAGRSASSDGLTSDVAFPLAPGFTELRWVGPTADARPSVASLNAAQPAGDRIVAVFAWVNATDEWLILRPDAPAFLSSLTELRTHNVYWFLVEVLPTPASAVSELDAWSPPNQLQEPTVAPHPTGIAAYDRDDWGDWIDADGDCEDARAEVLIAESQIGVAFRASDPCVVDLGLWFGELTGFTFTLASDVDVDHHVPLANAHLSGGWAWSAAEREAYTNDLGNPDHLIAVDDSTNQSKGSRGPDAWRPPRMDYWCKYAVAWTVVKNNYALTATADEWTALQEMLNTCPGGSPTILPSVPTSSAPENCAPSYPSVCIPPPSPDLNCGDIPFRRFRVTGTDPHRFDGDRDGIGCES